MTVKMLATGAVAVAAIAAGVVSVAPGDPAAVQVQPAVLGIALDPPPAPPGATDLPTAEQLTNILTNLADAGVGYQDKNPLVEGGIPPDQGHILDHELRKAYRHGELPLTFNVANIAPAGPNIASADVTVSGPKLPAPVTKTATFVNQGGWMLSQDSAMALMQVVGAR